MPDRLTTGIEELDEMLEGGIPMNSTVIIMGDKGTGKEALVNRLVYEGLKEEQEGLYVSLDGSPDDVKDDADYYGWDYEEYEDQLVFVDGYSWQAGGSDSMFALDGLSDMNQMNMTLTDAMRELTDGKTKRVAINSASSLLLYTDPQSTLKFLQVVAAKSTASGGCLFITLEESTHEEQTKSTVNHVADGVIKLKMDGDDKKISINRMDKTDHTRDWKTLEIDKDDGKISIED